MSMFSDSDKNGNTRLCNSAEKYLDTLSPANSEWYDNNDKRNYWIFRGSNNSDLGLLPSIYRNEYYKNKFISEARDLDSISKNIMNNDLGDKTKEEFKNRLADIIRAAFVEVSMIEDFLYKANSIQLYTSTLKVFRKQYDQISSVKYFYNNLRKNINKFYFLDEEKNFV